MVCDGANWVSFMNFLSGGNVGLGVTSPSAKLDVSGGIRIGDDTDSCTSTKEGTLRYSTSNTCMELCDGTNWECLQGGACPNGLPDAFSFTDQTSVSTSTVITSNIVQITGITGCTVGVAVSGDGTPEFRICSDSGCSTVVQGWTSSNAAIENNEYLQLRLTSSAAGNDTYTASAAVGSRVQGWSVATQGACSDSSPPVGTFCADGTVFIGFTPDGGTKAYAKPCWEGKIWDGTTCDGGSPITPQWATGQTINTGVTDFTQGETNTSNLAALSNADSPYSAAEYCDGISFGGHSDWYLPSETEGDLFQAACDVLPQNGCGSSTEFWTSSEDSSSFVRTWKPNGGGPSRSKGNTKRVRCLRKD